jgi:hypothetical protein
VEGDESPSLFTRGEIEPTQGLREREGAEVRQTLTPDSPSDDTAEFHLREVSVGERGVMVAVEDPTTQAPGLLRALLAEGLDVYACEPVQTTLEALFLDVVRGAP